jgi:hypothetical protein
LLANQGDRGFQLLSQSARRFLALLSPPCQGVANLDSSLGRDKERASHRYLHVEAIDEFIDVGDGDPLAAPESCDTLAELGLLLGGQLDRLD